MPQHDQHNPHHQYQPSTARKRRWPWVVGGVVAAAVIGSAFSNTGGSDAPVPLPAAASPHITEVLPVAPPAAPPVGQPATAGEFTNGVFEVPADMPAGKYKTAGPDQSSFMPNCYWSRAKDSSGQLEAIIANGNIQGPGVITVKSGEVVTFTGSCTWTAK